MKYFSIQYHGPPSSHCSRVTICDSFIVRKALDFARTHSSDMAYNHVVRSWIFSTVLAPSVLPILSDDLDSEVIAVGTILHDLGWELDGDLTSTDKRFEVDGANAAPIFLLSQEATTWDRHRVELAWDTIALHATPSMAMQKELEVVISHIGITADIIGPGMIPGADTLLTPTIFDSVVAEFPRLGFKNQLQQILCEICRQKPDTTYDNFVGDFGVRYVDGYSRTGKTVEDMLEKAVP